MSQPIIIEDSLSIAGSSTVENVIAQNESLKRYQRAPFRAKGKLVAVGGAPDLSISLDYGSKNVASECQLRVGTDMQEPDDVVNQDFYLEEGDMMILKAVNVNLAALNLRYRIILTPWEGELPPDCRVMQKGPIVVEDGEVDTQLLDGLRYERPPVDSLMEVFMSTSAAGLTRSLDIATDNVSPPCAIPPTNRMCKDPFDKTIEGVECPKDELISLSVTNQTGGDLNVFWKIKLYEMART